MPPINPAKPALEELKVQITKILKSYSESRYNDIAELIKDIRYEDLILLMPTEHLLFAVIKGNIEDIPACISKMDSKHIPDRLDKAVMVAIKVGRKEVVQFICNEYCNDMNSNAINYAFASALINNELEIANYLELTNKVDINMPTYSCVRYNYLDSLLKDFRGDNTILTQVIASENIQLIRNILAKYNNITPGNIQAAFLVAIQKNNLAILELLLDKSRDIKIPWGVYLADAARFNSIDILRFIIKEHKKDLTQYDIQNACIPGTAYLDLDTLKQLIEIHPIDINAVNESKDSVLSIAAANKRLEIVRYIKEQYKNINSMVLQEAYIQALCNENITLDLLQALDQIGRIDINLPDDDNDVTILSRAIYNTTDLEIIEYLMNTYQNDMNSATLQSAYWHAVSIKDAIKVLKKLDEIDKSQSDRININLNMDDDEYSIFEKAVSYGNLEAIKYLIATHKFIDKDILQKAYCNAAAVKSNESILVELENTGKIDINIASKGSTPLDNAVQSENLETVRYLIAKHKDINLLTVNMAYVSATYSPNFNKKIFEILESTGKIDINLSIANKKTPLAEAACRHHIEEVQYLLNKYRAQLHSQTIQQAYIEACNNHDTTILEILEEFEVRGSKAITIGWLNANLDLVLQSAMTRGAMNVLKYILKKYQTELTSDNLTLLCLSAINTPDGLQIINALIDDKRLNVQYTHQHTGETILMQAIRYKSKELVAILLQQGANVNAENHKGESALIIAVKTGDIGIVEQLLKKNVVNINNEHILSQSAPLTALESALLAGNIQMMELLIKNGANVDLLMKHLETLDQTLLTQELAEFLIKHRMQIPVIFYKKALSQSDVKLMSLIFDNKKLTIYYFTSDKGEYYLQLIRIGTDYISLYENSDLIIIKSLPLLINFGAKLMKDPTQSHKLFTIEHHNILYSALMIDKIYEAPTVAELEKLLKNPMQYESLVRLVNRCRREGVPSTFIELFDCKESVVEEVQAVDEDMDVEQTTSNSIKRIKLKHIVPQIPPINITILKDIIEQKNKETQELLNLLEQELTRLLQAYGISFNEIPKSDLERIFGLENNNNPKFVDEFFKKLLDKQEVEYLRLNPLFAQVLFTESAQQKCLVIMPSLEQNKKVANQQGFKECGERMLDKNSRELLSLLKDRYYASQLTNNNILEFSTRITHYLSQKALADSMPGMQVEYPGSRSEANGKRSRE